MRKFTVTIPGNSSASEPIVPNGASHGGFQLPGEFTTTAATLDFQVRDLPSYRSRSAAGEDLDTFDDNAAWPWKTPQGADGADSVSQITGIAASDCYQFPTSVLEFEQFRIVAGSIQSEVRRISVYLAG